VTPAEAEAWLAAHTRLPRDDRSSLSALLPELLQRLHRDRPCTLGIAGAPGCGKSTLARLLVWGLEAEGTPACRLSLDDYYLPRRERERLAGEVHPLFAQRGAPGTHDLDRLLGDLDRLRNGRAAGLRLVAFDKSTDDRAPESNWREAGGAPSVIVLEGWCVGAPPQQAREAEEAFNGWESAGDPDGSWRRAMLAAWRRLHEALACRLDAVWYIRVPDWQSVVDWRWQQEQELDHPNLESRGDVRSFLAAFERIVDHMQRGHADWAELTLALDRDHHLRIDRDGAAPFTDRQR
jgi:D-glycerate 3-kinase